jgi:hypothetical protein
MEIQALRLRNQQLSRPMFDKPEEVVRWMGAVQAQDFLYSLWALGLRLPQATEADIEQAITNRAILRTWPMRGTVHFVPAEDAAWMLALLAQRVINMYQTPRRKAGLDEELLAKSRNVLTQALAGKQLTRKEVYAALEAAGIAANQNTPIGTRGLHIIGQLALEGLLCFGPRRGKQPTFVLLDEWVPHPRKLAGDEAMAELASRYFRSHGPATAYDFAWWAGLPLTSARLAIELVKPQLERETIDDQTYWFSGELAAPQEPAADAYLLPYLDEYTVAYQDRSALVDPSYAEAITASSQFGVLGPVIVIGGRVAGGWKRTLRKDKVIVETNPVIPLTPTEEAAIAAAMQRFGNFVGLPVEY